MKINAAAALWVRGYTMAAWGAALERHGVDLDDAVQDCLETLLMATGDGRRATMRVICRRRIYRLLGAAMDREQFETPYLGD